MLRKTIVTLFAFAVIAMMSVTGALARGGFGGFRGGGGFRAAGIGRGWGRGVGLAGLGVGLGYGLGYPWYGGYPAYYGGYYGDCPYVYRTVMTPWGWRRRLVQICY